MRPGFLEVALTLSAVRATAVQRGDPCLHQILELLLRNRRRHSEIQSQTANVFDLDHLVQRNTVPGDVTESPFAGPTVQTRIAGGRLGRRDGGNAFAHLIFGELRTGDLPSDFPPPTSVVVNSAVTELS